MFEEGKNRTSGFLAVVVLTASALTWLPVSPAAATVDVTQVTYNNDVCNLTAAGYSGAGTDADPYQISDSASLWETVDCDSSSFRLVRDLNLEGASHGPTTSAIGAHTGQVNHFSNSTFDGDGHEISGISISSTVSNLALFISVQNATFSDLVVSGFINSDLSSTSLQVASPTGGLIANAEGNVTVTNIQSNIAVTGQNMVGGLIGKYSISQPGQRLKISDSTNTGAINSSGITGGLVGKAIGKADLLRSHNTGLISNIGVSGNLSSLLGTGGLVGYHETGNLGIEDSTNSAVVAGSSMAIGGILGRASASNVTITGTSNVGALVSNAAGSHTGGLIGLSRNSDLNLDHVVNTADISGNLRTAGLIGGLEGIAGASDAFIAYSENAGDVICSLQYCAGLVGESLATLTLTRVSNRGDISGQQNIGGLVGWLQSSGDISASINYGNITDSNGGVSNLGGIVGVRNTELDVDRVMNLGNLAGGDSVGGFVGYSTNNAGFLTFEDSANLGSVTGIQAVGSLIGEYFVSGATVSVSVTAFYGAGTVIGSSQTDPLFYAATSSPVFLSSSYVVGSSIWGGISVASEALKTSTTFINWDFSNMWGFGNCAEYSGWPVLRFQNLVSTHYSDGCYTAAAPSANPGPPTSYIGPVFQGINLVVTRSDVAIFEGHLLETIIEVKIGGVVQNIISTTRSELKISVSELTPLGSQQLSVTSDYGTLSVMNFLDVRNSVPIAPSPVATNSALIGKTKFLKKPYASNESWLRANLTGSNISVFVCTIPVDFKQTQHQRILARKQAKAACDLVQAFLPSSRYWFQAKTSTKGKLHNRAFVTFKK